MDASRLGAVSRMDKRGGLDFNRQGFFSQSVCSFDELTQQKRGQQPGLNQQHAFLLQGLIKDTELQFQQYIGGPVPSKQHDDHLGCPTPNHLSSPPLPRQVYTDALYQRQMHFDMQKSNSGPARNSRVAFQEREAIHDKENKRSRSQSRSKAHSRSQTVSGAVTFASREEIYDTNIQDHLSKSYNINSEGNARPRTGRRRSPTTQYMAAHSNIAEAFMNNPNLNILDAAPNVQSPKDVIIQKQSFPEKNFDSSKMLSNPGNARPRKQKPLESKSLAEWSQYKVKQNMSQPPERAKRLRSKSQADWELDEEVERCIDEDEACTNIGPTHTGNGQDIIYINNRPFQVLARDPNSTDNFTGKHVHVSDIPRPNKPATRLKATTKRNPFQSYSMDSFRGDTVHSRENKTQPAATSRCSDPGDPDQHPLKQSGALNHAVHAVTNPQVIKLSLHNVSRDLGDSTGHPSTPKSNQPHKNIGKSVVNNYRGPPVDLTPQTVSHHSTACQNQGVANNQMTSTVENAGFGGNTRVVPKPIPAPRQSIKGRLEPEIKGSAPRQPLRSSAQHPVDDTVAAGSEQRRRRSQVHVADGMLINTTTHAAATAPTAINRSCTNSPPGGAIAIQDAANTMFTPDYYHLDNVDLDSRQDQGQVTCQGRLPHGNVGIYHGRNNECRYGEIAYSDTEFNRDPYVTFTTNIDLALVDNATCIGTEQYAECGVDTMVINDRSEYITADQEYAYINDPLQKCGEIDTMTIDMHSTTTEHYHHQPRGKPPIPYAMQSPIDDGLGHLRRSRPKSSKARARQPMDQSFADAMDEAQSYNNDDLILDLGDLGDDDRKSQPRPTSSKGRNRSLSQTDSKFTMPEDREQIPPNSPDYEYVNGGHHRPTSQILKRREQIGGSIKQQSEHLDCNESDVDGEIEILDLDIIETMSNENSPRLDPISLPNNSGAWKPGTKRGGKGLREVLSNPQVDHVVEHDDTEDSGSDRPMTPRLTEREVCDMRVEKMHSIKKAQRHYANEHTIQREESVAAVQGHQADLKHRGASPVYSSSQGSQGSQGTPSPSPIGPEVLYNHFGGKVVDKYRKRAKSDVLPIEKLRDKHLKSKSKSNNVSATQKSSKNNTNSQGQLPRKLQPLLHKSGSVERLVSACSSGSDGDSGNGSARDLSNAPPTYPQHSHDAQNHRLLPLLSNTNKSKKLPDKKDKCVSKGSLAGKSRRLQPVKPIRMMENSLSLTTSDVESPPDSACDLEKESSRLEKEIAKLRGLAQNKTPRSPKINRDEMNMDKFFGSTSNKPGTDGDLHCDYILESARSSAARSRADLTRGSQEDLADPLFESKVLADRMETMDSKHKQSGGKKKNLLGNSKSVPSEYVRHHHRKKSLSDIVKDFQNVQTSDM